MYPRAPTAYATQADKWKRNGKESSWRSSASPAPASPAVSELVLVSELCSAAGQSSFPPKEVLNTFVRVLPSLDRQYTCELLEQKLGDSLWQVIARALLVLDAAFGTAHADDFLVFFACKLQLIAGLTQHPKQTVKSRAEKVLTTLNNFEPPPAPAPVAQYQAPSPVRSHYGYHEDLLRSPTAQPKGFFGESLLSPPRYAAPTLATPSPARPQRHTQPPSAFAFMSSPEPTQEDPHHYSQQQYHPRPQQYQQQQQTPPPASVFNFLNVPVQASPAPTTAPSGFSFMSSPLAAPVASPSPPAPITSSSFSFLTQPTPSQPPSDGQGFSFMTLNTPPQAPVASYDVFSQPPVLAIGAPPAKTVSAGDHIHDAFEGLGSEPDENAPEEDLLSGFLAPRDRRASAPEPVDFAKLKLAGAAREVVLEIDIPAGPMGIILDKSIPSMGVIERFVPLPTGEKGYIEMHPAITPGCALVSVNFTNVEHASLDDLGPILAAASGFNRVLKFKKFIVGGRVMHPLHLNVPYIPPSGAASEDGTDDAQPPATEESQRPSIGFASPVTRPSAPPVGFMSPAPTASISSASGFDFLLSSPAPPSSPPKPVSAFNFMSQPSQVHYGHGLGAATSSLFPSVNSPAKQALVVSPRHRASPARAASAFAFMSPSSPPQVDAMAATFGQLEIRGSQAPPSSAFGFMQPSHATPPRPLVQSPPRAMSAFDFLESSPPRRGSTDDEAPRPTSAFSFIA
ncbi:hypothetical protein SDRG_05321 [Saprolegnia diclina VS20]|uniref:Uncharacterized protein n=1 Tax=Saprolegnia diclina (strain VS20) TaxID=1156394 RepID=T0QGK1_SAPDV|nr:hypothetical protein SDRG_05321 [Saprolegnia diclina VS20]EQC37094.1 hypothetical protein SDRG_05321 [Saprolegnia diclina VS20]|eukprot:XP_008609256.1 hypothetical protein SDRG_05321 [Saprolegnia diclina VS20]